MVYAEGLLMKEQTKRLCTWPHSTPSYQPSLVVPSNPNGSDCTRACARLSPLLWFGSLGPSFTALPFFLSILCLLCFSFCESYLTPLPTSPLSAGLLCSLTHMGSQRQDVRRWQKLHTFPPNLLTQGRKWSASPWPLRCGLSLGVRPASLLCYLKHL